MKQNIVYVGLDVDDTQYYGSALDKTNGEVITFKCRPTLKGLLYQLDRIHKCFPGSIFRVCYEASYIGYTLQRDLVEKGYHCDVIAPTSIPSPRGKQVNLELLVRQLKGIKNLFALTMITEIGDIKRFPHPR